VSSGNRTVRIGLIIVGIVLAFAASGASAAASAPSHPVDLKVVETPEGPVLAYSNGRTLYVYVDDLLTKAPSACTGDCANDWPPALAPGKVTVSRGVTGEVGTITRSDGQRQLTMDRRPLYLFSGDRARGDIRGNGIGNIWWAMTPTGLSATAYPLAKTTYGSPQDTTLTVVPTRYGPVVANDRDQVLYTYADDSPAKSACIADWCLVDWPPLQAQSVPTKPSTITAPVGTITGGGGTTQVTLAGHPLYAFAGDLHPGDTRGQAIGDDWYLISPTGSSVTPHGSTGAKADRVSTSVAPTSKALG
jgi:predicted lipoprotein with Yx(FWY)xxD motif